MYGRRNNCPTGWKKQLRELVSEPEIVGYFSVDGQTNYLPDSSGLVYWKPPTSNNVCFDLNRGIESAIHRTSDNNGRIRQLLQWVKLNHADIRATDDTDSWIEPNFVCSAGLLKNVMSLGYTNHEGWLVYAARWKGTVYMYCCRGPEGTKHVSKMPKKFDLWSMKFMQYLFSEDPSEDPNPSRSTVWPTEFRCVFRCRIGDHSVLYSGAMNGLDSKVALKDPLPLNDLKFVRPKTNRIFSSDHQYLNFQKNALKRWWAEGFLLGVEKTVCGFRDDDGIVSRLKIYTLSEMLEMAKGLWNPVNHVTDCCEFLDLVAKTVVDDCDETIYKFEKIPDTGIFTEKLSPQSEYAFLSPSFLAASE